MSRLNDFLRTIPPATLGVISLCCLLYAVQIVTDLPLHAVTLCPRLVVHDSEYYRIVTSSLFHANFMHIGMNMMSTTAIGSMLEKRFGTLRMIITMLWSIILSSVIYIASALFLSVFLGFGGLMYQHSIGFSGVIFHLSVLECNLGPHASRSVFGMLDVPSSLYPWVLLIVLQMFMPNLSFLGHLSGIIAGTLQLHGIALIPKESYLRGMDDWNTLRWLSSTESFVGTMSIQTTPARNALNLVQLSANRGFRAIITLFSNATGKFIVAIFRRGRAANSNIQLDSLLGSQSESSTDDYSESRDRMPPVSSEVPRPTISQIL